MATLFFFLNERIIKYIILSNFFEFFKDNTLLSMILILIVAIPMYPKISLIVKKVSLYPNPTVDHVNIRFEGLMTQDAEVRVYDVAGKLLQTERVSVMETRIEMNHYAPGVYFFRILFEDDTMQTLKVVKR